jgi:hypothetical protein
MSNTIHWGFANTPATYTTEQEKFEITVAKMRLALNIHPDHEITIYNHGANQPTTNDASNSNSISNTASTTTVPKRTKTSKTVEETVELQSVPTVLGDTDLESPVL